VLFIFGVPAQAQDSESDQAKQHTVGISARRFMNVLFKEADYAPELLYLHQRGKVVYRLGVNLSTSTSENAFNTYLLSIGVQKTFKKSGKWEFYFGSDVFYQYEPVTGKELAYHSAGLLPFFGVKYALSSHFSLSTEPGFYGVYRSKYEPDAFIESPDVLGFGMMNIGYLRLNFSF